MREDPLHIAVQINPDISGEDELQYVQACLNLETDGNYPEQPAKCKLQDVKGQ